MENRVQYYYVCIYVQINAYTWIHNEKRNSPPLRKSANYPSKGVALTFNERIAHLEVGTLEAFCVHANEICERRGNEFLTPEYVNRQYEFLKDHEAKWLDGYGTRYSSLFLHELATHNLDNSCGLRPAAFCRWLYNKIRPYNIFKIYDEICALEWEALPKDIPVNQRPLAFQSEPPRVRKSITKKPSQLKGRVLGGFWHKHHTQAEFILNNIHLQHKKPKTKARLTQFVERSFPADSVEQESWNAFSKLTAHECTITTYEERAGEGILTGEWIVYASHDSKNYYLTLASHIEPDEAILNRIGLCRDDFPFLNEYPQFKGKS